MSAAGGGEEVKLLGSWPSPYVTRVRIALSIRGVGYEFLEEKFGCKSELLLESNPAYKKIPVLIHGGKPICESMVIVQYIDDVWAAPSTGPSFLPSDPYHAALARFWAVYIDDKWIRSLFGILIAETEEAKEEPTKRVVAGVRLLEEVYEKHFNGRPFFGGDSIGYLDIALGCTLGWIGIVSKLCDVEILDAATTPQLVRWSERLMSVDAVRAVIPEADQFMEAAQAARALLTAEHVKVSGISSPLWREK